MTHSFFAYNHQDKGDPFIAALSQAGWSHARNISECDLILADLEGFGRNPFLEREFQVACTPTVLYPHGGLASCTWNFRGVQTFNFVKSVLVPSSGWQSIMSAYGCSYRTTVTGWPFGWPMVVPHEFVRTSGRSILFAPIHPNTGGFLSMVDRERNRHAYQKLLGVVKRGIHTLTVRHIGALHESGLYPSEGVHYEQVAPSIAGSIGAIKKFDIIVASSTFAYLAVSMGVPTIMIGEFVAPHFGNSEQSLIYVKDWQKYKHTMMFPLDIMTEDDTHFLIERACYSDYEIEEWKKTMIGGPFDPRVVVSLAEEILDEQKSDSRRRNSESHPIAERASGAI